MTSAAESSAPEPLELDIFNLSFRLRAPRDEHERIKRAARHVDTVMRDLVSSQPSADTTRLAIQAAFVIATEYSRSLDESIAGDGNANQVAQRVDDILRGLDMALADMKSVMTPLQPEPVERRDFAVVEEPELEEDGGRQA